MRLIDADALKAHIKGASSHYFNEWSTIGVLSAVDKQPTIDAVPVVRCKDCKYRGVDGECPMYHEDCIEWVDDEYAECEYVPQDNTHDDGFCDFGERTEDGTD